jgi:hypothetical protein
VETSEQTQVTVTLHMAWSQPEHWSNCFKALNATPLYELFLGPTLSHVKWWGPILGPDDLDG